MPACLPACPLDAYLPAPSLDACLPACLHSEDMKSQKTASHTAMWVADNFSSVARWVPPFLNLVNVAHRVVGAWPLQVRGRGGARMYGLRAGRPPSCQHGAGVQGAWGVRVWGLRIRVWGFSALVATPTHCRVSECG